MITVAGQKRFLSDLVASIKGDPLTPWRRATKRTEGQTTSYYYSKSHVANTYEYARLV